MATQTPNLGLTLPVGTENVSRQVINGNNTLIDTFAGNVNTAMDQMGSNMGILETGDTATHSIAKGEYVTWKGASYTADAAISIGETLAATGGSKNLTACDKGIANALNSKFAVLEGTTPAKNSNKDIGYPTGFTFSNTSIVSIQVQVASAWRTVGSWVNDSYQLEARLLYSDTCIRITPHADAVANVPYKIVVMKG